MADIQGRTCDREKIGKKAICCRVLFALHGFLVIWRVVDVYDMKVLYALFVPVILFPLEFFVGACFSKKCEW